jgi:ATP-dependent exoDNAse (exonuclease V) alpha subunit
MDSGRTAVIPGGEPAHVDHGYAVTSHSAQGATADKVIVHAESGQSAALVNERFAYVAGSRMRDGLDVYTDNSQQLTSSLERRFDKMAAVNDRSVGSQQSTERSDRSDGRPSTSANQSAQMSHAGQGHSARQEQGHAR